jgi:PKD repeat protein
VAAGAHHSYALRSDGTAASWGRNYRSELGDGTTTQRARPVSVLGVAGATSLGSGRDMGVVTLADGRVKAWGHNAYGQLGDGTKIDRTSSVFVPGVTNAVKSAGGGATFGVVLVGDGAVANQPPTARITGACTDLSCPFSGSASTDDGSITGYAWNFGDGTTGTGTSAPHTYVDPGTYTVTLTVTDNLGATGTDSLLVTVAAPPASAVAFRAAAALDGNTNAATVVVPAAVRAGDRLVLIATTNTTSTATTPAGWTLLSSAVDGVEMKSSVWTRTATSTDAGSTVRVALSAVSKTSLAVTAYSGAGPVTTLTSAVQGSTASATHPAPAATVAAAGSTVLRYWADKASTVRAWTLPSSVTRRAGTTGSGGGLIAAVAGDTTGVPAGTVAAATATSGLASDKALAWTIVVPPA